MPTNTTAAKCQIVKCPRSGCGAICSPENPNSCKGVYICPKCKVNNRFVVK